MENRYRHLRCLAYLIEIIVFFIVQQTPGLLPEVLGGRPVLLLPILVSIALFEDEMTGLWFGLLIGILLDVSLWDVIGVYAILYTAIGYFLGLLAVNFLKTNLITTLLMTASTVIVIYGLSFLLTVLLKQYDEAAFVFVNHYLSRMVYTLALCPIFYFFNKALALGIRVRE